MTDDWLPLLTLPSTNEAFNKPHHSVLWYTSQHKILISYPFILFVCLFLKSRTKNSN